MTMTGYYEADWLSSGTTSNNNQSNSYTMRQRQLWADAKTTSGWDFSGGTGWSLVAETASGLTRGTEVLPSTIDAQYDAGFVWARQESFRVSKNIGKKAFVGMSVENAETPQRGRPGPARELCVRFYRNRRRSLQLGRQLLLQHCAGLGGQDGLRARLGPLGSRSASAATSATASILAPPYRPPARGRRRPRPTTTWNRPAASAAASADRLPTRRSPSA